jgi:hypothetical protein
MSKKLKLLIAIILIVVASVVVFRLLKPRSSVPAPALEVSVKEANVLGSDTVVYQDWAGFSFSYPQELKIEEVELDDASVYSSLEISGPDGQKLTLKIADTQFASLADWQESFEQSNVPSSVKNITWVDIPGLQLTYGAPQKLLTVAYENNVLYRLESLLDQSGFWTKTHQLILDSFKFAPEAMPSAAADQPSATESPDIILLEEEIIE